MEYAVPVILFVAGFGAAFLARKAATWAGRRGRSGDLPVNKGAVRLDHVTEKGKNRHHS